MKTFYTCICAGALALLPLKSFAAGGPDAYGYTWITSLDPGGPVFSWIDITSRSGVQTVTGLADDNSAPGMVNLGFNFHYYWNDYSQLKVGSNGWVSFDPVSNIASCFPVIPTAGGAGDNILAPLMGDLNFTGAGNPGQVMYWTNNVDSFIISYINVPFWQVNAPGWIGSNSFQVILCNSDSSITYQYGALSGFSPNAACIDLTVGIENSTGAIGLQVHSDATPPANYVIRFDYPATVLLSVQDALPLWNATPTNKAEFVLRNVPYDLVSDIKNGGNTNITTTTTLQATVLNSASATVHSSSGSLPSLAAGDDTIFTYPAPWTPTINGQYTFRSALTNSQDINAGNNTNDVELDVVDPCLPTMSLNYLTTGVPDGSLNWNGGANDDGAAVYYRPPVYPYTIAALQYYISSNAGNDFIAQVYADDGVNGGPGTLLFNTTVASASITAAAWNTVNVTPAVTLPSGGFYVVWLQGGTTIFLGTESAGPRSRQNYEILDGSWAEYRENSLEDICIRASITGYAGTPIAGYTSSVNLMNVTFTDTTVGPVISWAWDFGDATTSTQQNPTHTYATTGNYNVCLIATSPCGSDTICQVVNICNAPAANFAFATTPMSAGFTDQSTGTVDSWYWNFGDGNFSTQQNPVHAYAAPGTYLVCMSAINACGDTSTTCQTVTVCAAPVAAFTSASTFLNASFTDQSLTTVAWSWDFGDSQTSTLQNPAHTYATPGIYSVCLIAMNACGNPDTACEVIVVCDVPVAAFTATTNEDTVFVTDQSSPTSAVSWLWDFGDGNTDTLQNSSHMYATGGVYTVCLTTTDTCGNTDSACQQVFIIVTSAAGVEMGNAFVFPNPVQDQLSISLQQNVQDATLEIFDVTGKRVQAKRGVSGKLLAVDVSALSPGIYVVRLQHAGGFYNIRFVRE